MNKAFTKTKELILDEKYKIIPDGDNGVVLIFLTEKENKKKEIVPHEEKIYFTRISQALRKWSDLTLNSSTTLKLLLAKTDSIYDTIDRIDKEFKQF